MKWIKFNKETCPKKIKMIFREKGNWFVGELINDSEYGYCIVLQETYISTIHITHYLIPDIYETS